MDALASALLDTSITALLTDASGVKDYALIAEDIEHVIAERAARAAPPINPNQLKPLPCSGYSPFQSAMSTFRLFMRTSSPAVPPPPATPTSAMPPPPTPPPPMSTPSLISSPAPPPSPFAPSGKPSSVVKGCPSEAKYAAANAAVLLDRVAADPALLAQLSTLDATARSMGNDAVRAALAGVNADVRALVEADIDNVDIGAFALGAAQMWRCVSRAASKGARNVIALNEDLLSDLSQAPNPQYESLLKHLHSGSIHLITEFMLSGSPNANKHKLFYGDSLSSCSRLEFSSMESRVRVVLEAFAKAHPNQDNAVNQFILNFRKLARFAADSSISVALIYDFVWVPFWREFAASCAEAKESASGRGLPLIQPSRIGEGGQFASRLNQAYLRSFAKQAPPRLHNPPAPPPQLNPGQGIAAPTPKPAGKGPPPGSIPMWNPQKSQAPGWVPLPIPRPPHNPSRPEMCRGWKNKGLCSYGQNCLFAHPGF